MFQTIIMLAILALKPEWREDVCERVFATDAAKAYCERQRDAGRVWAEEFAGYMAEEAERWGFPAFLLPAVAYKEGDLEPGDICVIRMRSDRITHRFLEDEERGRWRFCWNLRVSDQNREVCRSILLVEESDEGGWVEVDRCVYGEAGQFQIVSREAPAGLELPWGEVLPRNYRERQVALREPRTNTYLGARALDECRTMCCEDDEECRADPRRWLGAYNTGSCLSPTGRAYAERVMGIVDRIQEAVGDEASVENPQTGSLFQTSWSFFS